MFALLAALVLAVPGPSALHVHLLRSDPAAGATVRTAPTSISLWFSEEVQIHVTTVHLRGADSAEVQLAAPAFGDAAHPPVIALIRGALKPGAYRVSWRTMARDGHAASGSFGFTLAGGGAASATR